MAFETPTLTELKNRTISDIQTRLPGADALLERSNLGVLAYVVAGHAYGQYGNQAFLAGQLFPWSSELEYLERFASLMGITRKSATTAVGSVILYGDDGSEIAAGTLIKRADGLRYVTDSLATISEGSALAAVTAEGTGGDYNTAESALVALVSPISGVETLGQVATGGIGGGADRESDASLKARLIARYQKTPQGGAAHDYEAWALSISGVSRVFVYPERMGAGTVGVIVLNDEGEAAPIPSAELITQVQDYIDSVRPVCAAVTVFAPTPAPLDFTISLNPDTATVRAAVEAELQDLIAREAEPDGGLLLSHIHEAISIAAGEYDHTLTSPAADIAGVDGEIITMGTITWS